MTRLSRDLQDFFERGLVVIDGDSSSAAWLGEAEQAIKTCVYKQHEAGWKSAHDQPIPFPQHSYLRAFLAALLDQAELPETGQVATVDPGYPTAGADHERYEFKRHVDGAETPTKLFWAQAIVGVLVTPLPSSNRGNPVHWPGSHFVTEMRMQQIDAFEASTAATAISNGFDLPATYHPVQLHGEPGTIFVVHHALHHGIAPNLGPVARHVVYYRIKVDGPEEPWLLWSGYKAFMSANGSWA